VIGNYDCIIVRSRTRMDAAVISRAERAKLIVRAGVGTDNIDIDAAAAAGIAVANTPQANVVSAAELSIAMMLALNRHICAANQSMHSLRWDTLSATGSELFGKILGIVGLGRVGKEVAKRAASFGMHLLASDPYVSVGDAASVSAELTDLRTLLSSCDILSLHASLLPGNRHLIGRNEIALMKKEALLINTARGELVDTGALADALSEGRLRGAALDVYENEPHVDQRLASLSSVLMTPHIGAQTREAQNRVGMEVVNVVNAFFMEGKPLNVLNMQGR